MYTIQFKVEKTYPKERNRKDNNSAAGKNCQEDDQSSQLHHKLAFSPSLISNTDKPQVYEAIYMRMRLNDNSSKM